MKPPPQNLPEGYYLDNFWRLLSTVSSLYEDLMRPKEQRFLSDFEALSLSAQRLYVRLLSRRGDCFRHDQIHYPEIPHLDDTIDELKSFHFAQGTEEVDLSELLQKLKKAELIDLLPTPEKQTHAKRLKPALISAVHTSLPPEVLRARMAQKSPMLRLLRGEITLTFRLMMFGSLSYDLKDFILEDLGVVVYEKVPLSKDTRLFPCRRSIDELLELSKTRDAMGLLLDAGAQEEALQWAAPVLAQVPAWEPTSLRSVDRILNRAGQIHERRGEEVAALSYFEKATRPPARERRARILMRQERWEEARTLCEQMLDAPRDETEAPMARRILDKILKHKGEVVPKSRRTRRKQEQMIVPRAFSTAEACALHGFASQGIRGFHAENALWLSLFGLAFWDIIFSPLPGAFQHPFQRGPLDLRHPEFRTRREEVIQARLESLRAEDWRPRLLETYTQKAGRANAFVHWEWLERDLVEEVLEVLPGAHLAVICDRLSRDIPRYKRGFPDLFLFVEESPGYRLLEVKGPGDQLRPEQGAWLDVFAREGIPACILKLDWASMALPLPRS